MIAIRHKAGRGDRVFAAANTLLLALFTCIIIYPIYYMMIVSISGSTVVMRGEVHLWPKAVNLDAYRAVFNNPDIFRSYRNTIVYTVLGTCANLIMSALCAYPLSRKHFCGRKFFSFLIIFTMLFDAGLVPSFMVVNALGLRNTIFAVIIPSAINAYYMILMRTFFHELPDELFEAARIDGANEYRIFFRILLPLSGPVLASVMLFYAVGHWNSYMAPLLYFDSKAMFPLQLILRNIVVSNEMSSMSADITSMNISPMNIKYAVIFVSVAPILCVYPFAQKYFTKGVMLGALKG